MASQNRWLLPPKAAQHGVAAYWLPFCLLVLALVIAGCGTATVRSPGGAPRATTPTLSGQGSYVDGPIAPVTLRNPAPGTLAISMTVTFEQQIGDAQPMTIVGLAFLSGGHTVQFAGDERVACDGADLALKNRVAVFQVLQAPAAQVTGTTVQCAYSAGGAVASVALQIPSAPAITSPRMDTQVVRSARTLVTYRYDPTTSTLLGIVALAPSSPSPKAIAKMNTPGPLHATVDTSGFAPSPGSLVLTASLTPHLAETGVPFQSVRASGSATTLVAVTWI